MRRMLFIGQSFLSKFAIFIVMVVAFGASAIAESVTDEDMQPIAARVGDVAAAVRSLAVREPEASTRLSEIELYLAATSHDPRLREAFKDFLGVGKRDALSEFTIYSSSEIPNFCSRISHVPWYH